MTYPSIISQSGSSARNLQPILQALEPLLEDAGSRERHILELGSFPYEHILAFAERWPEVEWWGSVRDDVELQQVGASLQGGVALPFNLHRPRVLDIARPEDWQSLLEDVRAIKPNTTGDESARTGRFEGVIMLNLIHCCPVDLPEMIFEHLSPKTESGRQLLDPERGWIAAYGAYRNDDGSYKSEADEEFDKAYIRAKHPTLGLRTIKEVTIFAERWGFEEFSRQELPKGNMFIVWRAAVQPEICSIERLLQARTETDEDDEERS